MVRCKHKWGSVVLFRLSITPNFKSFSPFHYLDMNLMWLILFTGEKLKPLLTAPFKQPINFSSTKCEFLYVMHYLLVATSSEFVSRNVIRNTILFLSWELSCCTAPFFPDPLMETCTGFVVTVPRLIKRLTRGFDAFPIFFFLVKFQSLLNHFPLGWLQRKTGSIEYNN